MTTKDYEVILHWLERRSVTFNNQKHLVNFVREPRNQSALTAAKDTFNLLLNEAKREKALCEQYGGALHYGLPLMFIS